MFHGDTNSGLEQATQPALNNTEDPQQTQENIPTEVATILDSAGATINDSDAELIRKMFPGMVDNDNQPLPENIPTEEEHNAPSQPQFFMAWEHSGSCFHCLEGGCKTKACINFNTDVKPTVEQLFENSFSNHLLWEPSFLKQTSACKRTGIILSLMESSFIGSASGFLWQQSMVQIKQNFGPWEKLIILLVTNEIGIIHVQKAL